MPFKPKGEFTDNTVYSKNDLVVFNGSGYVSIVNENIEEPTGSLFWKKIVDVGPQGEQGIQGPKGDTFVFEDLTDNEKESLRGDIVAYNTLTDADKLDLASRVPANGVVEEGNTQAVSGGEVYDKTLTKDKVVTEPTEGDLIDIYDISYVKDGWNLNSAGVETANANRQILSKHPLPNVDIVTVSGWQQDFTRTICFYDSSNTFISPSITRSGLSFSFPKPVNAASVSIIMRGDVANDVDSKNTLKIEVPAQIITKIDDKPLKASELTFETLKPADLTYTESTNLADKAFVILDKFIDSVGDIFNGSGWRMIAIDVSSYATGTDFTFGNFIITGGGYSAFYNENTLSLYNGTHNTAGSPKTVTKPAGATLLYIDIARPADVDDNWQFLTVNVGDTLLPYEDPKGKVTAIKGHELAGASLDDDPTFNSVTANVGNFGVLDINNVPIWDEVSSTSLVAGDIYAIVDGSNFYLKIKG